MKCLNMICVYILFMLYFDWFSFSWNKGIRFLLVCVCMSWDEDICIDRLTHWLQDSQVSLQMMLSSQYLADHRPEAESWTHSLTELKELTQLLQTCQTNVCLTQLLHSYSTFTPLLLQTYQTNVGLSYSTVTPQLLHIYSTVTPDMSDQRRS